MQNAKDTFYTVLRDRLALVNPDRTVVVRGVTRPAIVVDENEAPSVAAQTDCFHLQWTDAAVAREGAMPLATLRCEVRYSTAGNAWNGGLDRGRVLASMDADLSAAVGTYPQRAPKMAFLAPAQGNSAAAMASNIWWSGVAFDGAKADGNLLTRTAVIDVMSLEEAEEV